MTFHTFPKGICLKVKEFGGVKFKLFTRISQCSTFTTMPRWLLLPEKYRATSFHRWWGCSFHRNQFWKRTFSVSHSDFIFIGLSSEVSYFFYPEASRAQFSLRYIVSCRAKRPLAVQYQTYWSSRLLTTINYTLQRIHTLTHQHLDSIFRKISVNV